MIFRTQFNEHTRFFTEPGKGIVNTYKMTVSEDGKQELAISGKDDLYASIQSYRDSVDINVILKRFVNGETDVLSRTQGTYGDFTQMPRTMAELQQRVIDAENLFNALPLETRAEFDYSPSQFFAAMGTEKFEKIFADDDSTITVEGSVTEPSQTEPVQQAVTGGATANE